MRQFDAARQSFKQGNYPAAQSQVETAIQLMPDDAVLHEFRALCLFAQKNTTRRRASSTPCWPLVPAGTRAPCRRSIPARMSTQSSLRALKAYLTKNPNSAAGHFVLAYQ